VDDLERFMSKTKRDPVTGCLLWTKGLSRPQGYGQFSCGGKNWSAHRWIFREKHGYLPEVVMHRCDTPHCVDWEKCLMPGTTQMNRADCAKKGRSASGERNGKSTLTDAQVARMREEYAGGTLSQRALAAIYGCSQSTVGRITRGKVRNNTKE